MVSSLTANEIEKRVDDMSISYESCFVKGQGKIVPVEYIQQFYEIHGNIDMYYGNMYCPECKKAELSFTHKTRERRAFFSKKKTSMHTSMCSFNFEYASREEIIEYVRCVKNVKDRLESVLNMLNNYEVKDDGITDDAESVSRNPFVIINRGGRVRKCIPRKSLWGDISGLENKLMIYYGEGILENIRKNGYYQLRIKPSKGHGNVFHVSRKNKLEGIENGKVYRIALLGELAKHEDKFRNNYKIIIKPENAVAYRYV